MVNEYEFSGPNSAVYYPNESQRTDSVEKMFTQMKILKKQESFLD